MADRVVSDQQLDGWVEDFATVDWASKALLLIAEVRASHAREAAARQAQAHTVAQFSSSAEAEKRYALEAERDVLQQRIDKALGLCDEADRNRGDGSGVFGHSAPAETQFIGSLFRAALTGGEQE